MNPISEPNAAIDAAGAGVTRSHEAPRAREVPQHLDLPCNNITLHFVTRDPQVCAVLDTVMQVADTDATILITGESGTGKEFIARQLHRLSSRAKAPLVSVNCGAIAETLQESEFFGHIRGAFTGATERRIGKFEAADGGTIFLDEISEMSPALQVKLLRVLQHGEYAPVGVADNRFCDVRVVAATNQDLVPLIEKGRFRQDLYYRLNVIRLDLPPLRARRGDIPLLIDHFLRLFRQAYQKPDLEISPQALVVLLGYSYPGNVRELENVIRRGVILCRDNSITCRHLPSELLTHRAPAAAAPAAAAPVDAAAVDAAEAAAVVANFHDAKAQAVEQFERVYLIALLTACGGIVSRAALYSGLSERNFHEKLKRYGISSKDFRARLVPAGVQAP